jgi:hypothetical protein
MTNGSASSRLRLVVTSGDSDNASPGVPSRSAQTPQIVLMPIDQSSESSTCDFAFELARALAAQTARTGAVVFAERSAIPKPPIGARRRTARGPLSRLRLSPLYERDGVLFFEPSRAQAVVGAVRGQMPLVAVCTDRSSRSDCCESPTALVVVVQRGARAEYVELLQGELAATETRPVHVVELDAQVPRTRLGSRRISAFREQAWALAAELVLGR